MIDDETPVPRRRRTGTVERVRRGPRYVVREFRVGLVNARRVGYRVFDVERGSYPDVVSGREFPTFRTADQAQSLADELNGVTP